MKLQELKGYSATKDAQLFRTAIQARKDGGLQFVAAPAAPAPAALNL